MDGETMKGGRSPLFLISDAIFSRDHVKTRIVLSRKASNHKKRVREGPCGACRRAAREHVWMSITIKLHKNLCLF